MGCYTDFENVPRRILVIGSPGAGKSTFSRKLRDRTGLPHILDFSNDQLPRIYQLLEQYADSRNITIFHSREEADAWLRTD